MYKERVIIYAGIPDEESFQGSARKFCRTLGRDFPWLHIHLTPSNHLEQAVLNGSVDCAIFPTRDLPVDLPGLDYFFLCTGHFSDGVPGGGSFSGGPRAASFDPLVETDLPERLVVLFPEGDYRFQLIRNAYIHPCSIAGAGAGHRADNLTIAVRDEIDAAEIILHDALINREVLDLAGKDCKLIDVGKRVGKKGWTQPEICDAMVNLTRRGYRVLRLKGGSPIIFARLQEEIDALEARALPYYVFPGIDTASAFSALYGGPLTKRGVASSVEISNLRPLKGNIKDVTQVWFMGVGALKENRLPEGVTIRDDQPMAAGYNIGGQDERFLQGGSAEVIQAMIDQDLQPPIIVVTGEAVNNYNRRQYLPLKEKRIWITQQSPAMTCLARELEKYGAFVVISPCLDEVPMEDFNLILFPDLFSVQAFGYINDCAKVAEHTVIVCNGPEAGAGAKKLFPRANIIQSEHNGETAAGSQMVRDILIHNITGQIQSESRIFPVTKSFVGVQGAVFQKSPLAAGGIF